MPENLVACEYEDSTNCIWNAQEQGNGIGESFVDIDGETFYIETTLMELKEVPEVVVEVPVIVDPVPEELTSTGMGDVVVGLLLGLAIVTAGVVLFIRGRKNK